MIIDINNESVFPVNDPDPNGYGVQEEFDPCFDNFFGAEDWKKLITAIKNAASTSNEEAKEFYNTVINYMEKFMNISEFFCIDSNL